MKVLALDIGSHVGLAWTDGEAKTLHWKLGEPGPENRPARAAKLWVSLQGFATTVFHPSVIVYERPFARGQHATRSLWGLAGIIEAYAHSIEAAVVDVTPAEIKKFAAGFGDAKKTDMLLAAELMGYRGDNEHEADAYCLLKYFEKHGSVE